ncbi:MAG TPA: DUF2076 family protein [Acetobacteraceae bacterium]|jgi:hypothetical protein
MTDEERDLITRFIQRVGGAQPAIGGGSVPTTTAPLPPIDPQADQLIGDLFTRYPESRYRLTQMAFVQEHALAQAQNQITRLQYELQQAKQAQAQAAPAAQPSPWGGAPQAAQPQPQQSRGLFGGLFGGGQSASPPPQPQYQQPQYQQPQYQQPQSQQPQYAPPPPQYAPGYQPGMFQRQGSGFLGSALTTAAGVAGGVVAGNALMNMFSGHEGGGGMFGTGGGFGGGFQQPPEVVEYVPEPPADAPWGGPPAGGPDPYDVGGAPKDSGWQDASSAPDSGGWTDADNDTDSSWTDSGNDDWQNT